MCTHIGVFTHMQRKCIHTDGKKEKKETAILRMFSGLVRAWERE